MNKPRLTFWQIWNMSFGFLGIQIGFSLQLINMSTIFKVLQAPTEGIPLLWIAAPLTGLLVQPIIGSMSDRTWTRLGRRRPFFLVGAMLSSFTLFLVPNAPVLAIAVLGLWIMDTCFNVAMEPFRAFVGDKLPDHQRTLGFIVQSFFIGVGGTIGGFMPSWLAAAGIDGLSENGIALNLLWSFRIGAVIFLLAVLWTVFTSTEYPPEDLEEFQRRKRESRGFELRPRFLLIGGVAGAVLGVSRGALVEGLGAGRPLAEALTLWHPLAGFALGAAIGAVLSQREVAAALGAMPRTMKQLAVVQFFTWTGLFCMWMFFNLATAQQVFGTLDLESEAGRAANNFGGSTQALMSITCFAVAFALPLLARATSRKTTHTLALLCGAAGLLATGFLHTPGPWRLTMIGVGIAWASILSMPYAMLSGALPAHRMGVYMGIFNFFIVIPEILASLCLEPVIKHFFHGDPVKVVMLGGASLLVAAIATQFVQEPAHGTDAQLDAMTAADEPILSATPPENPLR
jgi:maltose/moltooligosaccharide transporter